MKLIKYKKIPYIELIPIIIITFILYRVINNFENVGTIINKVLSILSYFIWGFVIAYVLNPLMMFIEEKTKLKRIYSIAIIYILFLGLIIFIITLITPSVIKSFVELFNNMPDYTNKAYDWANTTVANNQLLKQLNVTKYAKDYLTTLTKDSSNYFTPGIQLVINNLMSLSSILIKLMTGIVISVYLLLDKESIILNIKKFLYSVCSEKIADRTVELGRITNEIFKKYFVGKLLDSILFGVVTFIGFMLLKIPYALPFSIFIGVTNMIPYFGNLMGMIPAALITLFFSPIKAIEIVVFIVTFSNIDGWFISPMIIGDKVGVSPVLIILGVVVGGGLFGILGMFLGVPMIALAKTLIDDFMNKKLANKEISLDIIEKK